MSVRSHSVLAAAVVAVAAFSTSATGAGGPANHDAADHHRDGQGRRDADGDARHLGDPPTTFTYAWQRCSDTGHRLREHRRRPTATTYVPTSADVGQTDRVVVDRHGRRRHDRHALGRHRGHRLGRGARRTPSRRPCPARRPRARRSSAADGTWAGAATIAFTYAWSRCDATGGACAADHGRDRQDLRAHAGRRRQDAAARRDGEERARQPDRRRTVPTAPIAALAPASVVTLPSGAQVRRRDRRQAARAARDRQGVVLAQPAQLARRVHGQDPRLRHARLCGAQRARVRAGPAVRPLLHAGRGQDRARTAPRR